MAQVNFLGTTKHYSIKEVMDITQPGAKMEKWLLTPRCFSYFKIEKYSNHCKILIFLVNTEGHAYIIDVGEIYN